jgi:hypothetical protein
MSQPILSDLFCISSFNPGQEKQADLRVPARPAKWPSFPCVTQEGSPSFAFTTMCPADGIPKFGCSSDLFRHGSCVFPPSSNGATRRRCALCLGQGKNAFCWLGMVPCSEIANWLTGAFFGCCFHMLIKPRMLRRGVVSVSVHVTSAAGMCIIGMLMLWPRSQPRPAHRPSQFPVGSVIEPQEISMLFATAIRTASTVCGRSDARDALTDIRGRRLRMTRWMLRHGGPFDADTTVMAGTGNSAYWVSLRDLPRHSAAGTFSCALGASLSRVLSAYHRLQARRLLHCGASMRGEFQLSLARLYNAS